MLIKIKYPDPQNTLFAALLIFSIALHAAVLSQVKWKIQVPEKSEVIFEVQLLKPEKKVIPPKRIKPAPPVIKSHPRIKEVPRKPVLLKKKKAPPPKAGKPDEIANPQLESSKKQRPVKPVPKPLLDIKSDIAQSADLRESDIPVGAHTPKTPSAKPLITRINVPESQANEQTFIPEVKQPSPALSLDPDDLKRVPQKEVLDARQIAQSSRKSDIKSEIRSQKETVQFRIVEQSGKGGSHAKGTEDKGESMIEGELRQRKVIFEPKPPVLNLEKDVTISLKFTVLPNGEVDQIIPFRKAEPELEKIAMQMLRQYRFEPLFENDKVQHGIIHFSIYRNK